jgi:hypothetical protein
MTQHFFGTRGLYFLLLWRDTRTLPVANQYHFYKKVYGRIFLFLRAVSFQKFMFAHTFFWQLIVHRIFKAICLIFS